MPLAARRIFRLALTTALALLAAYALAVPLPFIAPLFALLLVSKPGPPIRFKQFLGLLVLVTIMLGSGLLLIPLLQHYPTSGVLLAALGLYASFYLTVNMGKGLPGMLLAVGVTTISAAGTVHYALANLVINALILGIAIAIISSWLVYPWFPEDNAEAPAPPPHTPPVEASWISLRATLIMVPVYLLALTNPTFYMPILLKSVAISQQSSAMEAKAAGRELLGSTFLAGLLAILFWGLLKLQPNLWMFFWIMLLFGLYIAAKLYQVFATRFPPSFWVNTGVTLLILVGPAVEDSANGKDPYTAFALRFSLFVGVALYAWLAVYLFEYLKERRNSQTSTVSAS